MGVRLGLGFGCRPARQAATGVCLDTALPPPQVASARRPPRVPAEERTWSGLGSGLGLGLGLGLGPGLGFGFGFGFGFGLWLGLGLGSGLRVRVRVRVRVRAPRGGVLSSSDVVVEQPVGHDERRVLVPVGAVHLRGWRCLREERVEVKGQESKRAMAQSHQQLLARRLGRGHHLVDAVPRAVDREVDEGDLVEGGGG